jgi:CBS domain-containing protein
MSIADEIRRRKVGHLELGDYVSAEEGTPVREVLSRMRLCNVSTALLTSSGRLSGIFTERDVLRKVLTRPEVWDTPVSELMTPNPVTVHPDDDVLRALRVMREGHFRDLPVAREDGRVLGNLTDNAIVRCLADHLQVEVLNLPPDPNQVAKAPEGA